LGNGKPPLLVEVENQMLALLFRLACSERDLRTEMQDFSFWLEEKRPELINEAPDSRAWFQSNASCTPETNRDTMLLGSTSPVFTLDLAFGSDSQHVGIGVDHVDRREENVGDKNRMDGDRMDEMDLDKDGLDTDKRMDIDRNPEDEGAANSTRHNEGGNGMTVHGLGGRTGEGNEEEDDDMNGQQTGAGKNVGGNDGMDDVDMDRPVSVAGNGGAEHGIEGRDNGLGEDVEKNGEEEDDREALSSIEDDDEGRSRKAEKQKKQKKPRKQEKLTVKIPSREQRMSSKLGKAGLRKETAIDVDAFFVSILLIIF
jgi:hypothetical protein